MMLILLSTAVWARETGSGGSQETEDTAKLKPQSGEEGTPHETATSKELDLADGSIVITETGYTQDNAESETAYTGESRLSGQVKPTEKSGGSDEPLLFCAALTSAPALGIL